MGIVRCRGRKVARTAKKQWTMQTLIRSDALLLVCPPISDNQQLEKKVAEWLMTKQVDYKSRDKG